MSQLSDTTLQIAAGQVGQKEDPLGSNWGHPVQDYLASVGIHFPASWCMAFLYWCVCRAVEKMVADKTAVWISSQQSFNPLYCTGGVLYQWKVINPRFRVPEGEVPQVCDFFIMDLGKGLGHTGIIEFIDADGNLHTIEGNTNSDGSRNGIEVERKVRHNAKPIIGYIRI